MAIASLANLIDQVSRSQLLPEEQQQELAGPLQARFQEPRELARELVRRKWLTPFQINQIVAGKGRDLTVGPYIVLERIGEGGMGQVYKARHRSLERLVAVKVVRRECLDNPITIRRFQREVQMAAQLQHPNIVRALDADEVGGMYYFVMEYIEGMDLARLVKDQGPLRLLQACDYIRQAALGLQHAHEHGMVHRDIKPANLLVSRPGSWDKGQSSLMPRPYAGALQWGVVKVLDMGLARLEDRDDRPAGTLLTQVGSVMGTPDFIAPEQARSARSADIRSDLYSLGCTLYFLLTGQVPFPEGSLTEKLLYHQMDEPAPLEQVRRAWRAEQAAAGHSAALKDDPAVLGAVSVLVRRLMAKKPEDRLQTPAELADTLAELARQALQPPAPRSSRAMKRTHTLKRPTLPAAPAEPVTPVAMPVTVLAEPTTPPTTPLPKVTARMPRPPQPAPRRAPAGCTALR